MSAVARVFRPALIAIVALAACCQSPSTAAAGEFPVRQCFGSSFQGFSGEYGWMSTVDRVHVVNGCGAGGSGKLGVYQDRSGARVPYGSGGQFLWAPVSGIRIIGTTFTAKLRNANGIRAKLIGPSGVWGDIALDEGRPHDGQLRTMRWSHDGRAPSLVVARLVCRRSDGCPNAPGGPKAFFEVFDLEVRSRDMSPPRVSGSGQIWDKAATGGWFRGRAGFRLDASDAGGGLARAGLQVNGFDAGSSRVACPGDRGAYATSFTPCPRVVTRTGAVDTSRPPFREGANALRFCVTDFAASSVDVNRACTETRTIMIDNVPPAAPAGLEVLGGSDWRPVNGFRFSWRIPPGQTAGMAWAEYRFVDTGSGEQVAAGYLPASGSTASAPLSVPGPGEYRAEIRLRDAAGNLGAPASVTVRFDNSPPGDVAPESPAGWVSKGELPLKQPIERAAPGGPSGIGGYAVAISRESPISPCSSTVCDPSELTVAGGPENRVAVIPNLAEGGHWVSAVATSGARVPSRQPGSAVLRVDKTDPETTLSGIPAGWQDGPVTITARASDDLSGMDADPGADDGRPVTVIAPDGQAPYETPGAESTFTVAAEGVTTVRYWARDLAGNANDGRPVSGGDRNRPPGTAVVKIDTTPPTVSFGDRPDRSSPEIVSAEVRDGASGLEHGRISIRRIGRGGPFKTLPTEVADGGLRARVPSDDLPAGIYELRAEAHDRAGNVGVSSSRRDGSAMVVSLPLKKKVDVSLVHQGRRHKVRKVSLGHGEPALLGGTVRRHRGAGLSGAKLVVEERFAKGSRRKVRRREVISDGAGRFAARLEPGPSRQVRVRYAGSPLLGRAESRRLAVSTRARTSLRVSPAVLRNGRRTKMRGAVRGRGAILPAGGKLVAIQYFDPARSRWRPVEVIRTGRSGRFTYSYRFRTIASAQRILFRALSLPEAGWPFAPSTSARKSVIVYPRAVSSSR